MLSLCYWLSRGIILSIIVSRSVAIFAILVFALHSVNTENVFSGTNNGTETTPTRLSGPIVSLQFSNDGNPLWIVSGRWRTDVNFDRSGEIPLSIKNLNVSLIVISIDGSITHRYKFSDFEQTSFSHDNETKVSNLRGMLKLVSEGQSINNVGVVLKIVNREVLIITLDTSKTKSYFGETPIYGIER